MVNILGCDFHMSTLSYDVVFLKKFPRCRGGEISRFARVSLALDPVSHGVGAGNSPENKGLYFVVNILGAIFI